jgi:hypothetical protein
MISRLAFGQFLEVGLPNYNSAVMNGGRAPAWAKERLKRADEDLSRVSDVLEIGIRGVSSLQGMPRLVAALAGLGEVAESEKEERVANAQRLAVLASSEIEADFPSMHGQALLSLCAIMESFVFDLCALWIEHIPESRQADDVRSLKFELGEYESVPGPDRPAFLVGLLEVKVQARRAQGVTKFERLLNPFGLSGYVDEELRRSIFEMFSVRNLILHRGSLVDARFKRDCTWMTLEVGVRLDVGHPEFVGYLTAATDYLTLLIHRVGAFFDVSDSQSSLAHYQKYDQLPDPD